MRFLLGCSPARIFGYSVVVMKDDFTAKARDDEYAKYSRALAGIETGDGNNHHAILEASTANVTGNQDKKDKDFSRTIRFLNELQRLLDDPAYADAFKRANNSIDTLLPAITDAMDQAAERMAHLESLIENMEDRAVKLDDGTAVFRDASGNLVREDGTILSPDEAAGITIPDNAPSWEQYKSAKDALTKARSKQDRLSDIQRQLLEYKDKLNDPNNPLTLEEVEELNDELAELEQKYEQAVSSKADFDTAVSITPIPNNTELEFDAMPNGF